MSLWLKTRLTILAIVALTSWLGLFTLSNEILSASPLDDPVVLNPPASIEKDIWLRLPETYYLEFVFSRENYSFEKLQEQIGHWTPDTDGVPVPLAWSLKDMNGKVVAGETTTTKGASGWGNDLVYRSVARIQVAPGRYHFRAQILQPVPELALLTPRLRMSINLKSTSSWQMGVLLWGMIFNSLVGLPILLVLVAYLLFIVVRHLTSDSSGPASQHSASR